MRQAQRGTIHYGKFRSILCSLITVRWATPLMLRKVSLSSRHNGSFFNQRRDLLFECVDLVGQQRQQLFEGNLHRSVG
jgi:hypothetical protein